MVTNEYGFWCKKEEIDKFPNIQLDFDSPEIINNVIIDIDFNTKHNLQKLFIELNDLKTKFLEVRIYTDYKVNSIKEILSASFGSRLRSINILTKYTDELSHNTVLESIIKPFPILGSFVIHSTPIEIIKEYKEKNDRLKYIAQIIDSEQCCGNISMQYFSININTFTEAQQFNTCLNKKVAIDKNGLIKNCPSMNESFGEFNLTSLTTVVSDPFFKEKWGIKKDEIKVCKDCQFRYICTDCRAYIADKSDKPLKCNYDPYTNKWNS
jgi:SPASM domain peptide maturase of grasp-with-spasm system